MRKKSQILFFFILVIAVFAGFFVYPSGFGARVMPWKLGLDLVGGAHLVYEVDMSSVVPADRNSVLDGLRDVIERRVNLFGVSEPQVVISKSETSYRLIVELAGITDVNQAIAEIGDTPFLFFAEVDITEGELDVTGTTTPQATFVPTDLTGRYITGASIIPDHITGQPQINLNFNTEGADLFEKITERNVGRQLAVFLDNELITAPVVQGKISGGRAQITGQFTNNEARTLVSRFNAGALPAPISLISQTTIGATLGADSLEKTIFAGAVGTALIAFFMLLYYRSLGFFAVIALAIYLIFNLFIFKGLSVTMSLAGIAGIVLSIGMAVDANILIFERMKEERRNGSPKHTVLEDGFKRAWPSIRDSNITTIITSVILFYLTSGFIKGFALALLIGVVLSMFSAITITRTLLRAFTGE
jgi:preprotein translocase subunit SecD